MVFKKRLSRKNIERSSSQSQPINHSMGLNVTETLVASYAMMSTTIAKHFSDDDYEQENISRTGMYHKNSMYESAIIHPVQCKRDIYVDKVIREKGKKGKSSSNNTSPYKYQATNKTSPGHEIVDKSLGKTQLRIKTIGVQPGHLRVETRETTETPRVDISPDPFDSIYRIQTMRGYGHRSALHTEISPSSTISSVTIPVELDIYTPKEILNDMMKSPQQTFIMCAIDEGSDGEITEL